jgi:hypothetical protein
MLIQNLKEDPVSKSRVGTHLKENTVRSEGKKPGKTPLYPHALK